MTPSPHVWPGAGRSIRRPFAITAMILLVAVEARDHRHLLVAVEARDHRHDLAGRRAGITAICWSPSRHGITAMILLVAVEARDHRHLLVAVAICWSPVVRPCKHRASISAKYDDIGRETAQGIH
jgi:hypothetical protein